MPPPRPAVFHGRDKDIDRLVSLLLDTDASRLAIVGPGGIGKTSLALAVLHDPRIRARFSNDRLFVSCEGATSADYVLRLLALKLGIEHSSDNILQKIVDALASRERTLLVLDNLESIWSAANVELKGGTEAFLAQMATVDKLALIVTTRDTALPGCVHWTNADQAELATLSSIAALQTFEDLTTIEPEVLASNEESSVLTQLLREIDFMPLAITLLARLADLPSRLLAEWHMFFTEVLEADRHDGTRRELSVQVSIDMSVSRLPSTAGVSQSRQLLSVCSMLVAGLSPETAEKFRSIIPEMEEARSNLVQHTLAYFGSLGELRLLSPIRHHIHHRHPPTDAHRDFVRTFFLSLAKLFHVPTPNPGTPASWYQDLANQTIPHHATNEHPNIVGIINDMVRSSDEADKRLAISAMGGVLAFAWRTGSRGDGRTILEGTLPHFDPHGRAVVLVILARFLSESGDIEGSVRRHHEALDLCNEMGDSSMLAAIWQGLARSYMDFGRREDATSAALTAMQLAVEIGDTQRIMLIQHDLDRYMLTPIEHARARRARQSNDLDETDRAILLFEDGDIEAALAILHSAHDREMARPEGPDSRTLGVILLDLGRAYRACGNMSSAEDHLSSFFAIQQSLNDPRDLAIVRVEFARLRMDQGQVEEAVELVHAAAEWWRGVGNATKAEELEALAEGWRRPKIAIRTGKRKGFLDRALSWFNRRVELRRSDSHARHQARSM